MMAIQVLLKVWKPKVQNRYIPQDNENDIDEGVFGFNHYKKALYRLKKWRTNIDFNEYFLVSNQLNTKFSLNTEFTTLECQ